MLNRNAQLQRSGASLRASSFDAKSGQSGTSLRLGHASGHKSSFGNSHLLNARRNNHHLGSSGNLQRSSGYHQQHNGLSSHGHGYTSSAVQHGGKVVVNKGGVLSSSGSMSVLHTSNHTHNHAPLRSPGAGVQNTSFNSVGHSHGVGKDGSGAYTGNLVNSKEVDVDTPHNLPQKDSKSNIDTTSPAEAFRQQVEKRQEKPKIIFLDVDGVLHSVRVTRQEQLFNSQKMALLRKLLRDTDSQIVLSSAWRRTGATLRMCYAMLQKHGIQTPIDVTPDFGMCGKRSNEILTWVDRFQITKWVAIDDLDLLSGEPRLRGHFLKCNPLIGLTNELIDEGTRILNSK